MVAKAMATLRALFFHFALILWGASAFDNTCDYFNNSTRSHVTVDKNDKLIINTDLVTMELCREEKQQNCSSLTHLVKTAAIRKGKRAVFTVGGNINIHGEVQLLGKRVVAIKSCYGNITIDSTSNIEVKCTDPLGKRISCLGAMNCSDCTSAYAVGGGSGGSGSTCGKNTQCSAAHPHRHSNDTYFLLAGNPGCNYNNAVAKGGGALELKASMGTITIESIIDASGKSDLDCTAGAGGTIRLSAKDVKVGENGKLIADGGDNVRSYCSIYGGTHGGGGGIIDVITSSNKILDRNVFSVKGGTHAFCQGSPGVILIKKTIDPCQASTIGRLENIGRYALQMTTYDEIFSHQCFYGPPGAFMRARCVYPWRQSGKTQWEFDIYHCWTKTIFIGKLAENTTNVSKLVEAVAHIRNLTDQTTELNAFDVGNISIILEKTSRLPLPEKQVTEDSLQIVDNVMNINGRILKKSQRISNSSNRIIAALKKITEKLKSPNPDQPYVLNLENFAVILSMVNTGDHAELYVSFNSNGIQVVKANSLSPNILWNNYDMFLEIQDDVFDYSIPRKAVFILYQNLELFTVTGKENIRGTIHKYVATPSIPGKTTRNRPQVTFRYRSTVKRSNISKTHCVFWDFKANENLGDWSKEGCEFQNNDQHEECRCNRLADIVVLEDVEPCLSYTFGDMNIRGVYHTKEVFLNQTFYLKCQYGPPETKLKVRCISPRAKHVNQQWVILNLDRCWLREDSIAKYAKDLNSSNTRKVATQIRHLTRNTKSLNCMEIGNVSLILQKISNSDQPPQEVSSDFYNTVDNILDANETQLSMSQAQFNSTNRIVESIERFSGKILQANKNATNYQTNLKNIAVLTSTIDTEKITTIADSSIFQVFKTPRPLCPVWFSTSFNMPKNILGGNASNVVFILYRKTNIFKIAGRERKAGEIINSYVMSASVPGKTISDVDNAIFILYPNSENIAKPRCVYWDFMANNKLGGWSGDGCKYEKNEENIYGCRCNHLTNFAMLLDTDSENVALEQQRETLSIISYIGCSVSLMGIVVTVFTVLFFRELLANTSSKIILNMCIALGAGISVFLAAAERTKTSSDAHCTAVAIMIHYFFLVALTWMAFEGYTMYFAFVKVLPKAQLDGKVPKIWICCLICWGVPAIIVIITASVAHHSYGNEEYCLLQGLPMVGAFFVPVVLLVPFNTGMFVFIMRSLVTSGRSLTSTNLTRGLEQARRGIAISVFLGLTWASGVLAIREAKIVFQYIFCITNSLQGWMIFVFYCVLSREVRSKYRNWLCSHKSPMTKRDMTTSWTSVVLTNQNEEIRELIKEETVAAPQGGQGSTRSSQVS